MTDWELNLVALDRRHRQGGSCQADCFAAVTAFRQRQRMAQWSDAARAAKIPALSIGGLIGDSDRFVKKELRPQLLEAPCVPAGIALSLRHQPGYGLHHHFISTLMVDHVAWHPERFEGDRR
jgi:S-formylglutathione hydrolase